MDDIIKYLTEDGKYANEICLLLLLEDKVRTLEQLVTLGITGKKLESLFNNCCFEQTTECLVQTTRYLMSGFLGKNTINENLTSNHPIPFIDRLMNFGEDWDYVYEEYTHGFFANKNKINKR